MTQAEIEQLVREEIVAILPDLQPTQISGQQNLKDLGADSVERIEIILALKRRLFVDAPLAQFSAIENIEALIRFLGKARQP
jgi:polyketide biosynthesis acyl carrier protein